MGQHVVRHVRFGDGHRGATVTEQTERRPPGQGVVAQDRDRCGAEAQEPAGRVVRVVVEVVELMGETFRHL
ncbi:hypothetical protein [Streptomyces sp. LN704]|uniref:hypothetical protein n=1 Tax=Streptomyces sp. LN704 TaxID=3112982 RepID=UPI00371BFC86